MERIKLKKELKLWSISTHPGHPKKCTKCDENFIVWFTKNNCHKKLCYNCLLDEVFCIDENGKD